MDWFRMYGEFATDPKVQSMSEQMQRRLLMLFCLKGNETLHTLNDEELAFALRIDDADLAETKALFLRKNFITEEWEISNWSKRQFVSDSSAERVAKYREKRKSMGLSSNGYTKHSETVIKRDGGKCVYCMSDENLCVDHAFPIIQGGNDDIDNLVCACKACNSGKAGRTPDQAGYTFQNRDAESRWKKWLASRNVTVTVTPQIREEENRKEEKKEKQIQSSPTPEAELFAGIDEQVVADFKAMRKTQKAKITKTAIDGIRREAGKAGITLEAALRTCCERGWRGFSAEWIAASQPRGSPQAYESAKDKARRETIAALTGQSHERHEPTVIDIN